MAYYLHNLLLACLLSFFFFFADLLFLHFESRVCVEFSIWPCVIMNFKDDGDFLIKFLLFHFHVLQIDCDLDCTIFY